MINRKFVRSKKIHMKLLLQNTTSRILLAIMLILTVGKMTGQTVVIFSENMGTAPSTTAIAAHTFQNTPAQTFSGSGDVRNSTPSSGYTGASGLGNVFITNVIGRDFLISGINTLNYTNLSLSFGHHKNTNASSNELVVEVSTNGSVFTPLTYTRASGTGTTGWLLITPAGTIPATSTLSIRFRNTSTSPSFRIDDVVLTGTAVPTAPSVTTDAATAITTDSATLNGTVDANNFNTDISFEYGTTTSYGSTITATPSNLSNDSATAVSASLTGLIPNTRYHFRAVGTVSSIATNGADQEFYTLANVPGAPTVSNPTITTLDVTLDSATENGNSAITQYAIQTGAQYVQLDGSLGATAAWQAASLWTTVTVTGLDANTLYSFQVKARNNDVIETSFGPSASGTTLENPAANVTLTSSLAAFGQVCVDDTATGSFTIDAQNLDGSDLVVNALNGYSFSTSETGTYSATLNISYVGEDVVQTVWVRFSPAVIGDYSGQISISGGGLVTPFEVEVSGSAINTAVSIATNAASNVASAGAQFNGSLTEGCSDIASYGFEYSTVAGFEFGTGTFVSSNNIASGNFSAIVSSLSPNTQYYYRALAADGSGTVYGILDSFTTLNLEAPTALDATNITSDGFTAEWTSVSGATGYRLDVSTVSNFANIINAPDLFISEYVEGSSTNKYIEIYNATGSTVSLSNYSLALYSNGNTGATNVALSGSLPNNTAVVYRNSGASLPGTTGYAVNSAVNFNGDDVIALRNQGTNIDVVGIIGSTSEPGADVTLRRKPSVFGPTTTYSDSQWDSFPQNTVSDLNSHVIDNVTPSFVPGYENLAVAGTSQAVTGLEENTTYYYRVRAESASSLSSNSNVILVTTAIAQPTFGGISQAAGIVCDGSPATFNLTGLLAESTSTISFNIGGGSTQSVSNVVADASGNASFMWTLSIADDAQTLTVTAVDRTDLPATLTVNSNNTAILSVSPNQVYYADADGDGYGNDAVSVTDCVAPGGYVTVSGDCNDSNAAVNPGAGEIGYNLIDDDCDGSIDEGFPPKTTTVGASVCGTTLPSIDSYIYANLVGGAQGYQWRVTTISGSNVGQVQLLDTPLRAMKITQLANYEFGATYQIEVAVYFAGFLQPYNGLSCQVSTPLATTQLSPCGQTLQTMNDVVYANLVQFATGYRFRITDPLSPSNTQEIDRTVRDFKMSAITAFQVQYNKTYQVEVAVRNTNGTYLPYGAVCNITTPAFPTVGVQNSQCDNGVGGAYAVPSMSTQIYAESYPGAISYTFRLTGSGLPVNGIQITKTLRVFTLNDFAGMGIVPGSTYNVNVRLAFNTTDAPGPFGKTCSLTVPGGSRIAAKEFNAVAYPNPFSTEANIAVTGITGDVSVDVYDMTGRLIGSSVYQKNEEISIGNAYPAGVYNVIVTDGNSSKTLRIVKR